MAAEGPRPMEVSVASLPTLVPQSQTLPPLETSHAAAAAMSQPVFAPELVPETLEGDPTRRQLGQAFDQAAFERDLERQLEMDERRRIMDEELAQLKRKHEEEEEVLAERLKQRRLEHENMLASMDREYSQRCVQHKTEMVRMADEAKKAQEMATAAAAQLQTARKDLAKHRVQDRASSNMLMWII